MSDILELIFSADTKDLDTAKEKLVDLGDHMPTVGEGIENLAKSFASLPGGVGLAAAASAGFVIGIGHMVDSTIELETQLLELSEAVGIPIEKLQPFVEAMNLAGISTDRLQSSLGKLSSQVSTALTDPTGKAADAFKKLGVSQDELAKGDIEQILKDTVAGLDKYADSATKTAATRELLGKQGPAIVAAMQDEAQFAAMAADAQEQYGTKITEADAKSSKYFGETLKLGMTMFQGVSESVTKSLLPGLQELVNQFAESGKQGGVMRDILDALSATISTVAKVLLSSLYEPMAAVILIFKEAGTAIGATSAAIVAAVHGNFAEAKSIMKDLGTQMQQMVKDYNDSANKFESALWSGTQAVKDQGAAVDANKPKFEAYNANAQKVADTIEKLQTTLTAQLAIEKAAGQSMEAYKAAQDDVATSALRLQMIKEGATKTDIARAVALKQEADAAKQGTADEVAGWTLINRLKTEQMGLTTKQTELEKNLAEIAAHPGMTDAEKAEATALATTNAALQQKQTITMAIQKLDQATIKDTQSSIAAMSLSTNQLKLWNQEMALRAKAEDLMRGKTTEEQAAIQAALKNDLQLLQQNNAATQQWTQSWAGFEAGASKAIADASEDMNNFNKIGQTTVSTFNQNVVQAFQNMGTEGSKAFKDLLVSMLQYFEGLIVKMLLVKAEVAAMEAMGISGPEAGAILGGMAQMTKSANGNVFSAGSLMPFANGGVVGQPTIFNMGIMAENEPEAIMPLTRGGDGRLGVQMHGGSSSASGGNTTYHAPQVHIHSNQKPEDIAKQVKNQVNLHNALTTRKLEKEQRPGGMLSSRNHAFAR